MALVAKQLTFNYITFSYINCNYKVLIKCIYEQSIELNGRNDDFLHKFSSNHKLIAWQNCRMLCFKWLVLLLKTITHAHYLVITQEWI